MTTPTVPQRLGAPQPARGLSAVTADEFKVTDAVGGVRGLVESVLPGFVFVIVFTATRNLMYALAAAVFLSLVAVVMRLIKRASVAQAVSGLLGIAIGVIWAWRSGEAQNFFALGLWQNAAYLVGTLVALLFRWPAVGVVIELMKSATGMQRELKEAEAAAREAGPDAQIEFPKPFAGAMAWRSDPDKLHRYTIATWLWVVLFAIRLAVQVPLFLQASVGWLGTARLVLGTPLWALVAYLTWFVLRSKKVSGAPTL